MVKVTFHKPHTPVSILAGEKYPKRTVIIDTAEQKPWPFPDAEMRSIKPGGDYTLDGLEHWIRIERKTLDDLVGSFRAGFNDEELKHRQRMRNAGSEPKGRPPRQRLEDEFAWIHKNIHMRYWIIEAGYIHIHEHNYIGGMHQNAVLGHLREWGHRYDLHVVMAHDRDHAFWEANRTLCMAERLWEEANGGTGGKVDASDRRTEDAERSRHRGEEQERPPR